MFLFLGSMTFAQNNALTQEDIIIKAQNYFDNQDYKQAMPIYGQLVSVHPDNPEYNYKFGICNLLSDRKDKKRPIRYLKIASQSIGVSENVEIYYYLGLAYHQNLQFEEAMKNYNLYLGSLPPDSENRAVVLEKVNACLNGISLDNRSNYFEVVSQSEYRKDNFHRAYRADNFDGMLIVKPDQLVCKKELEKGENSFVFVSEPRNILYFSGYENEDSDNKDIFKVQLLPNGDWGKIEKLPSVINTLYDEDYPVLTNNGTTLIFCSKGHNSLGGYDVFKSDLDTSSGVFTQPENLGIGVNSPFNDILYIEDKEKEYAYFSSDRDYLDERIGVFKVRLTIEPGIEVDDPILADATLEQPKVADVANETESETETQTEEIEPVNNVQLVAGSVPNSDASKHAAAIITKKTRMNNMVDSAYMLVATTKKFVREITNKRDRANNLSQKKAEEAKTLEIQFDELMSSMSETANQESFDALLEKAVALKLDICQSYAQSNKAKLIAWEYGQQIKLKNEELIELKKNAGRIQTMSISSSLSEVTNVFTELSNAYISSDTLSDYSEELIAISNNSIEYDIPENELAFVDQLRIDFQKKELIANGEYKKPENLDNIPIVVVDNPIDTDMANNTNTHERVIVPLDIVEPISFEETQMAWQPDEQLEIRFEIDKPVIKTIPNIIEPIEVGNLSADNFSEYEELEINIAQDLVSPIELVTPFDLSLIVQNEFSIDEELEINYKVDQIAKAHVTEVVLPIYVEEMASVWMKKDEPLKIRNTSDNRITAIKMVEPIVLDNTYMAVIDMDENEVDINFDADTKSSLIIPDVVQPIPLDELAYNSFPEEESVLEISFVVDNQKAKVNSALSTSNDLFYLRELASDILTIESNRTDDEILTLALTDYDKLSYEELLYAASLANSPQEKLRIFNVTFTHIDRDWRAFNNAAVTAIQMQDFYQAECFLYQASLISENNGKVFNNMGVLSCYRQEFKQAEAFFVAASNSGVNSEYNLQVVNSMTNENNEDRIIPGVSVMETDALSDIIDYSGSAE